MSSRHNHGRVCTLYMTLLLRDFVWLHIRKAKETWALGVRGLTGLLHSLPLIDTKLRLAHTLGSWSTYCLLDKLCAHGSAPCSLGNGWFLGALAILGFCNVDGLDDGAGFIGSPVADAAVEHEAATWVGAAGGCCWLAFACHCASHPCARSVLWSSTIIRII